jgi:hypothetical protein
MAYIRYEVVNRRGGWCIASGAVVGPPYNRRNEAVRDALAAGALLATFGDGVDVFLEDWDGTLVKIEPDALASPRPSEFSKRKPPAGHIS